MSILLKYLMESFPESICNVYLVLYKRAGCLRPLVFQDNANMSAKWSHVTQSLWLCQSKSTSLAHHLRTAAVRKSRVAGKISLILRPSFLPDAATDSPVVRSWIIANL